MAINWSAAALTLAFIALAPDGPAHAYAPEVPVEREGDGPVLAPVTPLPSGGVRSDGKGGGPNAAPDHNGSDEEDPEDDAPPFGFDDEELGDPHVHGDEATPVPETSATHGLSDVRYGKDGLPPAVAAAREALSEAARTGEIDALRPIFDAQQVAPLVDPYGEADDAVTHLGRQSGDAEGREILAILLELLETGHVVVGQGSARTYVWPYFAHVPLSEFGPAQYVDLYRILTAVDVEEMERLGRYTFFRVGIGSDGRVRYFMAGDPE